MKIEDENKRGNERENKNKKGKTKEPEGKKNEKGKQKIGGEKGKQMNQKGKRK